MRNLLYWIGMGLLIVCAFKGALGLGIVLFLGFAIVNCAIDDGLF